MAPVDAGACGAQGVLAASVTRDHADEHGGCQRVNTRGTHLVNEATTKY